MGIKSQAFHPYIFTKAPELIKIILEKKILIVLKQPNRITKLENIEKFPSFVKSPTTSPPGETIQEL